MVENKDKTRTKNLKKNTTKEWNFILNVLNSTGGNYTGRETLKFLVLK